jgi:hypothetical protein
LARIGQPDDALIATPRRDLRRDLVWGAGAIGAVIPLSMWMRGFTIDDALISVRYARHLADSTGYRFNAGGASTDGVTPLPWPFVLAPFAHASALVVLARAKAIGFYAWVAAAAGWGVAVGRANARTSAKLAAIALLATCLPVASHAVSGMETGVAMALATTAAIVVNPWAASGIAGVAASFRPEMIVWSVALAIGAGPIRRASPRVLVTSVPFVLCAVIRTIAFGRAAPLSLLAKPSDLDHGLAYAGAAALVSLAPIVLFAPMALARARGRGMALAFAGLAHFAAIVLAGGDWMPYARLAAPVVPSLLYAFVLASPHMSRAFAAIRVALALALAAYVLRVAAPAGRHVGANVASLVERARPLLDGARTIAAVDIGWPTAASEATIVDLAGVTDPEIASLPGGHTSKRVDAAFLVARDPDVILLYRVYEHGEPKFPHVVAARLAASDLIAQKYETRAFLPYGEDGAGYVVLGRR